MNGKVKDKIREYKVLGSQERLRTQMSFIEAHSLGGLIQKLNSHNEKYPEDAILKEDIVQVLKEEGTYILLYYRTPSII